MLTNSIRNREIILQAAATLLQNASTQKQTEAKMILNSGSQLNHIIQKVRQQLNLKTMKAEEMSIDSFGKQ